MPGIDADSRKAVAEFVLILVWCLWATMISWFWPLGPEREFDPIDRFGTLCVAAASFVAVIALVGAKPLGGKHLNRWDEAVALYGADCLLDIAAML